MNPTNANSDFFGQKVSIPGVPVNQASDSQLVYKNDWSTQTWYGKGSETLKVGSLGSSAYGMSVPASKGTLNFGLLSDGSLGIQVQDTTGYILFEMTGQTWFWYDKTTGKNVMQVGLLPDGTYGWAVAASGYNVSDGF